MVQFTYSAPPAVTEYRYGIPMGWYVDCDSAVCRNCVPKGFASGDFREWGGFESWEEPLPICFDDESDSVTHCRECGAVIAHDLTIDGTQIVLDTIMEFICDGSHNAEVMAQWWDAYADTFSESDLREVIEQAMANQGVPVYVGPKGTGITFGPERLNEDGALDAVRKVIADISPYRPRKEG